ncbi:NUDIX hydrolase [Evansella tamaricis]|uniref:CoA pyrophosphatase n=1 Tax=Evansella tamaricis TaxID=2069301 RepID=A0ABS6JIY9_9BACI|nr:CoA pyrophosphatase [Evansella tamaricis]MBU9713355.1 CoA pyrophosphatase [Evansella tamaricis]
MNHFQARKANILEHELYKHFAIFVPLIKRNGVLHFVFEVRAQNIRQPGEVCFPGGKVDSTDASYEQAATRELCEELGVVPSDTQVIGELDYLITPFQIILYPFLGMIHSDAPLKKNDAEVKEIFYVPVSYFLKTAPQEHYIYLQVQPEKEFPYHLIPNGENYNWRTSKVTEQFYEYDGKVIWGLTARILTHVMDEIKKSKTGV